jgi:hypothetical protein
MFIQFTPVVNVMSVERIAVQKFFYKPPQTVLVLRSSFLWAMKTEQKLLFSGLTVEVQSDECASFDRHNTLKLVTAKERYCLKSYSTLGLFLYLVFR